jgi:hypothetical protein
LCALIILRELLRTGPVRWVGWDRRQRGSFGAILGFYRDVISARVSWWWCLRTVINLLGREFRRLSVLRWEVRRQRGRQGGRRLRWHFDGIVGFYRCIISARVGWRWLRTVINLLGREFRRLAVLRWEVRRQRGRQGDRRLRFDGIVGFYRCVISAGVSWRWRRAIINLLGRESRRLSVLRWEVGRQRGRQGDRRLRWHFDGIVGFYRRIISAGVSWRWLRTVINLLGREFRRLAVLRWEVRRQRRRQGDRRLRWQFDGIFGFYGCVISAGVSWRWLRAIINLLGREFRRLSVLRWGVRRQRGRQRGRRLGWQFDGIVGFYRCIISARVSWRWLRTVISLLGREFRRLAVLRWGVRRQRGRQRGRRLGWQFDGIFGFYGGVISARLSWRWLRTVINLLRREFLLLAFLRRKTVLGWIRRKGGRKGGEGGVCRIVLWRRSPVKGFSGECGRVLEGL